MDIKNLIRTIDDYPKAGIKFYDLIPILSSYKALDYLTDQFALKLKNLKIQVVAGIEARGFIIAMAIASKIKVDFLPIRKKGKLPYKTFSAEYSLEYGVDKLEVHQDSVLPGTNIYLVDDLIATGGTALASLELITKLKAKCLGFGCLINLENLNGLNKLKEKDIETFSILNY